MRMLWKPRSVTYRWIEPIVKSTPAFQLFPSRIVLSTPFR